MKATVVGYDGMSKVYTIKIEAKSLDRIYHINAHQVLVRKSRFKRANPIPDALTHPDKYEKAVLNQPMIVDELLFGEEGGSSYLTITLEEEED